MKFEAKLDELEKIVKKLEDGKLGLDESIELFEKGIILTKECRKILDEAEKKITVLVDDGSGNMTEKTFPDLETE